MAISHRLARLERRAAGSRPSCPACRTFGPTRIHVPMPRVIGEPEPPAEVPERCAACGRHARIVLKIQPPRALACGTTAFVGE